MADSENHFDASRAELFEALGHPVRVKILHALDQKPVGFAELKKATGIKSSGHLQFHLGKLSGLIDTTNEGHYILTDDGREAIRVLSLTPRGPVGTGPSGKQDSLRQGSWLKPLVAILLIALVALSGIVVYQQTAGITRSTTTVTLFESDHVDVLSVSGPIRPYSWAGPEVSIALKNAGNTSIVALNATLRLNLYEPYIFAFSVSESNALLPGQSVQAIQTLIGGSVQGGVNYPLTVNGTLAGGPSFSFTVQVEIVSPS